MRRTLTALLSALLILSLAACGNSAADEPAESETPPETVTPAPDPAPDESDTSGSSDVAAAGAESNALVAYFGLPETDGTDTVAGASRVTTEEGVVGNTQFIAQAIAEAVGGELFAIETVQAYPGLHEPLVD